LDFFILLVTPIIAAIIICVIGEKNRNLRNIVVLIPSIVATLITIYFIQLVIVEKQTHIVTLVDAAPFFIRFRADPWAIFMAFSMAFLWILTNFYSFGYMAHEHAQTRYFAALTLNVTAAMGICYAENFVTFFLFFELLTIAVYPLVIHEETHDAYNAGIVYGSYLFTGGAAVLAGFCLIYALTGTTSFMVGGIPALAGQSKLILTILFILFTFGFGFKSALFPFQYYWLPEAMIAPTPISAVLHAVAVVNVGLFGIIRVIFNIFGHELYRQMGFSTVLAIIASMTIIVAAVLGLRQKELKKMIAFSTMNQLSYVLLGVACLDITGKLGGILHVYYHAFMKICLFYCAGIIITQSGNKYISKMSGLAKHMPITMICFFIGAYGVTGLPPVAGWISKFYMIRGYLNVTQWWYAAVLILSSMIELGYFTRPLFLSYLRDEVPGEYRFKQDTSILGKEGPWSMLVPIIIVAFFAVVFGLSGSLPHFLGKPALEFLMGTKLF
jgi:formate hydrogenlyase subunit 3/multisubunit Na+/H+ antiporter MnhD subunit